MVERKSVVVYFNNEDFIRQLSKKDINVYYISKTSSYAILYFDKNKEAEVMHILNNKAITSIETSEIPFDSYSF